MSQLEMLSPDTREFFERPKGLLINNEWLNPLSGQYFDDVNPSTKSVHAQVARATEADVERAAKAARDAFYNSHWHNMAPNDRGRYLWKLADLMEIHQQELAELDSLDMGMPIRASRYGTVPLAIDHVRYMAGWATKITGESIGVSAGNYLNYTLKEPVGVVGAIIPWNFPLLMAVWKISAALAAGCTVVLKPAEQSPLSAIRLGELIIEAGFPAGVVNIVTGLGHEAGAALSRSPWVNKIAFTGSTAVGQTIMREAAHNMTRVSLELGGKSPNIIFEDASLNKNT
ncbi:MAG: aldehyde dehydrogenase family protein, partial [Firmicutes bacterium]|nr:aldehyde dehydrogenase family protein [Bacillota bacterium]